LTHSRRDTTYLAPGEKEAERYASNRAWEALMLAQTPEAWALLLRGEKVPSDQLDHRQLERVKRRMRAA
jgi:hypothetical protein